MNQNVKNIITIIVSLSITAALVGFCTVMAPKRGGNNTALEQKLQHIDQLSEEEQLVLVDELMEQQAKNMEAYTGQPVPRQQMSREEKLAAVEQLKQMMGMNQEMDVNSDTDADSLAPAPEPEAQPEIPGGQVSNGVIYVTTPLIEKKAVILQGIDLCEPVVFYPYAIRCDANNQQCMTYIYMDEPLPDNVTIKRKYNNNCHEQTLDNLAQYYYPAGYKVSFYLDEATMSQLNIKNNGEVLKTANSQFAAYNVSAGMSASSAKLYYELIFDKKPEHDEEVMIDKTVVKLSFSENQAAQ